MDLIRTVLVLCLPWVSAVWQIYVLVTVLQTCSAAFTPTFQATIPEVLTDEALGAHARDELGIIEALKACPLQAVLASALSFFAGAALPLPLVAIAPAGILIAFVAAASLILLALLGGLAAHAGGANIVRDAFRICFWGALAIAVTAGVGKIVGSCLESADSWNEAYAPSESLFGSNGA